MLNREKKAQIFYDNYIEEFFKIEFSNLAEKYDPFLNIQNLNQIHSVLKILWHRTLFLAYLKDAVVSH